MVLGFIKRAVKKGKRLVKGVVGTAAKIGRGVKGVTSGVKAVIRKISGIPVLGKLVKGVFKSIPGSALLTKGFEAIDEVADIAAEKGSAAKKFIDDAEKKLKDTQNIVQTALKNPTNPNIRRLAGFQNKLEESLKNTSETVANLDPKIRRAIGISNEATLKLVADTLADFEKKLAGRKRKR